MEKNLSLEKIDLHDHVACFYRNESEKLRLIARLLRIGMDRNERCYCLLSESKEAQVRQALRDLGVRENEVRYSPALAFVKALDLFLGGDGFVPDRCLDSLNEMVRSAEGEGYSGARFICEAGPIIKRIGYEKFNNFESCWNESVDTDKVSCICLFDAENGSHGEVLGAVSTHPSLVIKGFVCRNFFYHPPEEFARTGSSFPEPKQLLEKMLDIQISEISMADEDSEEINYAMEKELAGRERAEKALEEVSHNFNEVLDGLEERVCILGLDHRVLITNRSFELFLRTYDLQGQAVGQVLSQIWPFRTEELASSCDRAIWAGSPENIKLMHLADTGVAQYDLRVVPLFSGGRVNRLLLVLNDTRPGPIPTQPEQNKET